MCSTIYPPSQKLHFIVKHTRRIGHFAYVKARARLVVTAEGDVTRILASRR